MFLPNGAGVFILGILSGWVLDVNLISAGSFLLSELDASDGLMTQVVGGLVFAIFLSRIYPDRLKIKFSVFAVYCTIPFFALILGLGLLDWNNSARAFIWFGLAMYAWGFFRWVNDEIAMRHLDPGRAQAYFFHLAAAREVGTILGFFTLRFFTPGFSPEQMAQVTAGLTAVWILFVLLQFSPRSNLELHFGKDQEKPSETARAHYRPFLVVLLAIAFGMGVFRLGQEYLTMLALKVNLGSFNAIKEMQADYFLIISVLTILIGFGAGRYIQKRRPSPVSLLMIEGAVLMVMLVVCWAHPILLTIIALEVSEVVFKIALSDPAGQMLISAFDNANRTRLRSIRIFFHFSLAGIPLLFILPWTKDLSYAEQTHLWLGILTVSLTFSMALLFLLHRRIVDLLYRLLESGSRVSAVLAAQALSFFRPRDYSDRMENLLEHSPGKFLRKTVIIGLGYTHKDSALSAIIREFHSEREEIQMAVLDALKVFRDYRATQFLVKIVNAQETSKSLQVRMNAGRVIAGLYGKKAIPFLLNGLEDAEPRIVANTLETLGDFEDRKLVSYFERFIHSPVPRVRLNALMSLARLPRVRRINRERIRLLLKEEDPQWVSSALYAIGKLRDRSFLPEIEAIEHSPLGQNRMVQTGLFWFFSSLKDARGFEYFGKLLSSAESEAQVHTLMHFFAQLSSVTRFDLIQYLVKRNFVDPVFFRRIGDALEKSPMDFHREFNYLQLLQQSLPRRVVLPSVINAVQ